NGVGQVEHADLLAVLLEINLCPDQRRLLFGVHRSPLAVAPLAPYRMSLVSNPIAFSLARPACAGQCEGCKGEITALLKLQIDTALSHSVGSASMAAKSGWLQTACPRGCFPMLSNDIFQARIDLAAAFRWAARLGYQTGTCNHFSFMAPGRSDLFLV